MELICGACHGRLLVESPGSTVACPHCGTFLQTPANVPQAPGDTFFAGPDDGPASGPDPAEDTVRLNPWELPAAGSPGPAPAETFFESTTAAASTGAGAPGSRASGSSVDLDTVPASVPIIRVSETGSVVVTSAESNPAGEQSGNVSLTPVELESAATAHPAAPVAPLADAPATAEAIAGAPESANSANATGSGGDTPPPASRVAAAQDETRVQPASATSNASTSVSVLAGVSSLVAILVFSYASAVTLLCGYLIWTRPSTLDLPDLEPPKVSSKKVVRLQYLPPEKLVPPANVLKLGESRRFGSVLVTPIRVTRGPIEFQFYKPEAGETRDAEGPVLKLHLRFDNVSQNQEFVPLDEQLVFTKEPDRNDYGLFKANNFVCNVDDRTKLARHVFVFDMPSKDWLVKDQHLDRELRPGESVETFVPTTPEQIETLKGELLWRVHFRKGYNPKSFRGVTTLIEVQFRSSDIIDEETAQPKEPAAKEA
jgi:hypothetical protein